ncbi:MAG: HDIG domain-containing protein [Leptolyngbya sp. SIO1E4]|nr:HDIG domain-containing protein [Leptolyngbya sp. SIO1E4]
MGERSSWVFNWLRPPFQFQSQIPLPPISKRCRPEKGERGRIKPAIALTLSIVTLTAAMGQRFYRQPELQVGTFAPKTVFAPESASVIDAETTEAKRTAARNGAVPVLVPNEEKDRQIQNSLNSVFKQVDIVRKEAGDFPFFAVNRLTTATQQYIQETPSSEWDAVWAVVEDVVTKAQADNATSTDLESRLTDHSNFWALSTQQQWIVRDLMRYQQQRSLAALQSLKGQIDNTRANYQAAILRLQNLAAAERGLPNDAELLRLSDAEWAKIQKNLHRALNNMLLQGIAEGVPREQLRVAGRAQLDGVVPEGTEALANALLMVVLEPNLEKDLEKTRAKAEAAAEQVNEVLVTVEDGEVIIYQGEIIGQSDFVLLDHFELSQRRLNIWGLMGFGVLVAGVTGLFLLAERTVRPALRKQDHGLIIFMLLGVSGLSVVGLAVYSLPAVGLLISSFYGATLGSTLIGALAILLPIGTQVSEISLLASAAGALVCSLIAPRLRSREEIALLGGIVGLIQGTVYLALTWVMSPVSVTTWLPLTGAILQGVYGIVSSVIALGLSPYLEHLFDLVTPIRLAELSSPNRPTLKRLASEAPGTFQHTLFVASLAEAAARALSCNVELVRAGTLYHDIGKMHDPLGFIENQMGGPNKHDEIADPWVSADIIKKHVSEGLVMARRCRLPKAVRAFIPEHQGNMLISYFYHQAKERAKVDTHLVVNEKDFRYDGPIPQSPETGIVMLADSCEAALRSLKDASTEEALAMVNRILKARWRDQQLVDSGLTREHMGMIAQVFVQVWQQYNHKRIAYPKNSLSPIINRS